jgi:hypothetical protein
MEIKRIKATDTFKNSEKRKRYVTRTVLAKDYQDAEQKILARASALILNVEEVD